MRRTVSGRRLAAGKLSNAKKVPASWFVQRAFEIEKGVLMPTINFLLLLLLHKSNLMLHRIKLEDFR